MAWSTNLAFALVVAVTLTACKYDDPNPYLDLRESDLGACAPLDPEIVGYQHQCQGLGNGWLTLDIHPVGKQPPECVNWGEAGKPDEPTIADCVPIELTALPNGIPGPAACCNEHATPEQIAEQCAIDCGYAACKLAVTQIRDAALALPKNGARGVVRRDLFHLANVLEAPERLAACADVVADAGGEIIAIPLGAGSSGRKKLGHVKHATLHLGCVLDPHELLAEPPAAACEAPANLP